MIIANSFGQQQRDIQRSFQYVQLNILERALDVPLLLAEGVGDDHPLLQELRVLMVFGVLLVGQHNQFKKYSLRVVW